MKGGRPQSAAARSAPSSSSSPRYNFFKLKIIGEQHNRQTGGGTEWNGVRKKQQKRPMSSHLRTHALRKNTRIKARKRPQTAGFYRPTINMTVNESAGSAALEPSLAAASPQAFQGIPSKRLEKELLSHDVDEVMIDQDHYEREKPKRLELKRLLNKWLKDADLGNTAFQSFAVFCEFKMRRGLGLTDKWKGPNVLRSIIVGLCLDKAAIEMPHYGGLLSGFAEEFYRSVIVDWDKIKPEMNRDGGQDDSFRLFQAKTYFEEHDRVDKENSQLLLRVNDLLRVQKEILEELVEKNMLTAVGVMKRKIDESMEMNQISFRRCKAAEKSVAEASQVVLGRQSQNQVNSTISLEETRRSKGEVRTETLATILDSLKEAELQNLVTDLGTHRSNVANSSVMGKLFKAMSEKERLDFVMFLSENTTEHEKMSWLETMPTGKRDGGFRFMLKKILNGEPFQDIVQSLRGNSKQVAIDTKLLKPIAEMKADTSLNSSKLHKSFLQTLSAFLYDDESDESDGSGDEKETVTGDSNGQQTSNGDKHAIERIEDVHANALLKLQQVLRQRDVARSDREALRNKVEKLEKKVKESSDLIMKASRFKSEMDEIDEKEKSQLSSLEAVNLNTDTSASPKLAKKKKPRRNSFFQLLQNDAKENVVASNYGQPVGAARSQQPGPVQAVATEPYLASLQEKTKKGPMTLEDTNLIIISIYQDKIIADSFADTDMRPRDHLSTFVRTYYVKQSGSRSIAGKSCSNLQSALMNYAPENFRCKLFALLIGSLEPRSYLNRVEATDFFVRILIDIFEIDEKELMIRNTLPVSLVDIMGDGLNFDGHRPCLLSAEKATSIIRGIFSAEDVSNLCFVLFPFHCR